MARTKEKKKLILTPSTMDIFLCLTSNLKWTKLLEGNDKKYQPLLTYMLKHDLFKDDEKIKLKDIAAKAKADYSKMPKLLTEMYNDIFELNDTQSHLFKNEGVKHNFHFRYFDNHAYFTLWLKATPRIHEKVSCYFMKAKVGVETYWVKDIYHQLNEDELTIDVWLNGGSLNRYFEMLVDRADFEGVISIMDKFHMTDYELEKELFEHYVRKISWSPQPQINKRTRW
jgi:hypothetical protein